MSTFKCHDFYMAGFLAYHKFPMATHYRDGGSTVFVFQESEPLLKCIEAFLSLRGDVDDALTFCSVLKI